MHLHVQDCGRHVHTEARWYFLRRHRRTCRLLPSIHSERARNTRMKWHGANRLAAAHQERPLAGSDDLPDRVSDQDSSSTVALSSSAVAKWMKGKRLSPVSSN